MSAIDISYWQHHPDFSQALGAGVSLVIPKCGGGEGGRLYTDSVYVVNRDAARAVGLAVGSYFFNGPVDPSAAADMQMRIVDWRPGDVVAVIGAGPVGLSVVMTARLYGPSKIIAIDLDDARLARAKDFGATDTVNSGDADWKERVLALTDGLGVDVAVEAVGIPQTFTMATVIVRPGGNVANIGVHGKSVDLALNELWVQNIDISMGLVNTNTLGMLLKLVAEHKLPADKFVTHEFSFDHILEAYDVFGHAAEHDALKVLIH